MNNSRLAIVAALVLALLVLTATVTGVVESAKRTAIPKQLTGSWSDTTGAGGFSVSPSGKVEVDDWHAYYARFSRVTKHRLSISSTTSQGPPYGVLWSCYGTGTYRWTVLNHGDVIGEPGHQLKLTKIHDPCKDRVDRFAGTWWRT